MPVAALTKLLVIALVVAPSACTTDSDPGEPVTDPARVSIAASVDDANVSVAVGQPAAGADGTIEHTVEVTWQGVAPVTLDDARFTHHISGERGGHLVLAGRGCAAQWDEQRREVVHPCTMDLQIIELQPGETHAYPARIHPQVGPLRLTPGTYVVEQAIDWQHAGEEGSFAITLTYTVD